MKKSAFLILTLCAFIFGCNLTCMAEAHFHTDVSTIDLGTLRKGDKATVNFSFINSGDGPLDILTVFTDCGCTSTSYPKESMEPGEESNIAVSFDSSGRKPGSFRKVIRVRSNADNPRVSLFITGVVED